MVSLCRYKIDNRTLLKQGRPTAAELPHFFSQDNLPEKERQIRAMAKEYNIPITDVDKIEVVFAHYDEDGSGEIEKPEFKALLKVDTRSVKSI